MSTDADIRQISRDRLFAAFKDWDLVRLFETVLYAVRTTIPSDTTGVQGALDEHIADPDGAHQASAIGATPGGSRLSNTAQGQLDELDTGKQAADATLAALAALVTAADRGLYFTGPDAPALFTLTAFARSLLDDANASAARATLGLGTIATQAASNVSITGGDVLLSSGSLGYAAGNGGTVTQATSKSADVTLNKICGQITLNSAALAAGASVSFAFHNSTMEAGDVLVLNHVGGGTFMAYHVDAQPGTGGAVIGVRNLTAGSLSEAIVLGFAVVKSATS